MDECAKWLINTLVELNLHLDTSDLEVRHLSAMTRLTFLHLAAGEDIVEAIDGIDWSVLHHLPQLHTLECSAVGALPDFEGLHSLPELFAV